MSVTLPPMTAPQERSWHALLDLHQRHPTGWTLVGGQMVHLLCAERGASPVRPTDDADAVLDVRAEPYARATADHHHPVRTRLHPAGTSWNGHQHRWTRDDGAVVAGRAGTVRRPNLLGALVAKAAAHTVTLDTRRGRHVTDFAVLGTLVRPDDDVHTATARDRRYLHRMLTVMAEDPRPWAAVTGAGEGLERLRLALRPRTAPARTPGSLSAAWTQPRKLAGAPAGGQFAARRRGEADEQR